MNADEVFRDGGEVVVETFPGTRSIGIERLTLIAGRRFVGIEERDIGWWAAEALIGVPAAPAWKADRKFAVGGAWRVGGLGRREIHRWPVGDADDPGRGRMEQVQAIRGQRIVLHLRTEGMAEPDQEFGLTGNRPHALQDKEPAGLAKQGGQHVGCPFHSHHESLGVINVDQPAEVRSGQRQHLPVMNPIQADLPNVTPSSCWHRPGGDTRRADVTPACRQDRAPGDAV